MYVFFLDPVYSCLFHYSRYLVFSLCFVFILTIIPFVMRFFFPEKKISSWYILSFCHTFPFIFLFSSFINFIFRTKMSSFLVCYPSSFICTISLIYCFSQTMLKTSQIGLTGCQTTLSTNHIFLFEWSTTTHPPKPLTSLLLLHLVFYTLKILLGFFTRYSPKFNFTIEAYYGNYKLKKIQNAKCNR